MFNGEKFLFKILNTIITTTERERNLALLKEALEKEKNYSSFSIVGERLFLTITTYLEPYEP
jgi:hypothetical protein